MMYWFGGMGIFGGLLMLSVWVAIILLVIWAVRAYAVPHSTDMETPQAILKRRYAAGEISQSEYERARRVLDDPAA